jgi:hypothetical protein
MGRRPTEYGGMAFCAVAYGVLLAALVVALPGPAAGAWEGLVRTVALALAALSFVAAEAIWRVRPWAYRAGLSLAWGTLACFLAPVAVALAMLEIPAALGFALLAGLIALIVLPMVGYLRRMQPQLHPRPRPRP